MSPAAPPAPAASPRYIVGIDLGTTNCALAFIDTQSKDAPGKIQTFPIAQVVAAGQVDARPTLLVERLYLPPATDAKAQVALPWDANPATVVGEFARARGAEVPARLVSSAKSWLCHPGVDRNAPILPWGAPDDVPKVSPVAAAAKYLQHMAAAWNAAHPKAKLASQDVLITVPASFDAVARELTVEAARQAGLANITLLEEPQAAFYSWLSQAGDRWRRSLGIGDVVLVCDVGGGTTDFTLIAVSEVGGDLQLERIAVGDYILLGGDNMDLALAWTLSQKLGVKGQKLDAWQQRYLTLACRVAKEALLGDATLAKAPVCRARPRLAA